jgi:hypothetical protein
MKREPVTTGIVVPITAEMKETSRRILDYYYSVSPRINELLEVKRLPEPLTFSPWHPGDPERSWEQSDPKPLPMAHLCDVDNAMYSDPSDPFIPWDPSDSEQWDFEHGPRFDDWTARTGQYSIGGAPSKKSTRRDWSRAVPALAWADDKTCASLLFTYLERVRLVVVDQIGVRRPFPGDQIEEAICLKLVELIEPQATSIEEDGRHIDELYDDYDNFTPIEHKLMGWDYQGYFNHALGFDDFLEVRAIGDGRFLVAFGPRASFPGDYHTLRRALEEPPATFEPVRQTDGDRRSRGDDHALEVDEGDRA